MIQPSVTDEAAKDKFPKVCKRVLEIARLNTVSDSYEGMGDCPGPLWQGLHPPHPPARQVKKEKKIY